jgi:hypothetical protein
MFAEAEDRAAKNPATLQQLKDLGWAEAGKLNVLAARGVRIEGRIGVGLGRLDAYLTPGFWSRSGLVCEPGRARIALQSDASAKCCRRVGRFG